MMLNEKGDAFSSSIGTEFLATRVSCIISVLWSDSCCWELHHLQRVRLVNGPLRFFASCTHCDSSQPVRQASIMAADPQIPGEVFLKGETGRNTRGLLRLIVLCTIAAAAIASRLFSVIRFESIIHEFDPWFNFRATKYLVQHGFYNFWDWFDDRTFSLGTRWNIG